MPRDPINVNLYFFPLCMEYLSWLLKDADRLMSFGRGDYPTKEVLADTWCNWFDGDSVNKQKSQSYAEGVSSPHLTYFTLEYI